MMNDKRKPAAWLHCEQPNAHVITDDIKELWREIKHEKAQKYTIPVYHDVPEQVNVKNEFEIFQGWKFEDAYAPFVNDSLVEIADILIRQPDGNCTIISQEFWEPAHKTENVLYTIAKMLKDAKQ